MTNLPRLPESLQVIERGWLSSNSILLFEGAEATLVDSGYVGHAPRTVELVKSALAGRRLVRLVNTHSHSDHIGGNAALQKAFGCEILIPAGIEEHIANWDEQALLLAPAAQRGDRFRHDGVVRPGERLRMGGLDWQALAAPGHDMDALVFHCPQERLLISGDALWEDGFGIIFGELLGEPGALQATRATLDMIAGLGVGTVIPGHGRPFGSVPAALERAYKRIEAFEADPARMARNAVKACFIFNLLDLQGLPRHRLEAHLASVPFFCDVGARLLGMDVPALAAWLLSELKRGCALEERDGLLLPTMAA
ncbi:MAG: MBL fold metallo-hydrolase [Rhodocyclaceae bacterium]|jgi:glyoxylase-like metal-dependent hydrolase (beta-lactamase superfamily II)|nr:MBL fold metallo-hydrolase [Rhodocyclaceae bacterium]